MGFSVDFSSSQKIIQRTADAAFIAKEGQVNGPAVFATELQMYIKRVNHQASQQKIICSLAAFNLSPKKQKGSWKAEKGKFEIGADFGGSSLKLGFVWSSIDQRRVYFT